MAVSLACPSADLLARFAQGALEEAEWQALEVHILNCGRCGESLARVSACDEFSEALQCAPRFQRLLPRGAAVDRAIERACLLSGEVRAAQGDTNVGAETDHSGGEPAASLGLSAGEWNVPENLLAPPQAADELGRLEKYRVLKLLDCGGMGMVFLAEDTQLGRRVALKVMKPALASQDQQRERFLREARAAAVLRHDNIVTIFHVGEERGTLFLAMELLEGESLEARLLREKQLPILDAIRIGQQVAAALAAAHDRGLIHRDIKPGNIWLECRPLAPREEKAAVSPPGVDAPADELPPALSARGASGLHRIKLLDFGLARAELDDSHLTSVGMVVGTPAYMAPEQARGEHVDHRCDLFSLGCVLYRTLTGRPPFVGKNSLAVLVALAEQTPPPVQSLRPETPPPLCDMVTRLLAKAPTDRLESAMKVLQILIEIETTNAAGSASDFRTPRDVGVQVTVRPPPLPRQGLVRSRRYVLPIALAIAFVAVAAAASFVTRYFSFSFPRSSPDSFPEPSLGAHAKEAPASSPSAVWAAPVVSGEAIAGRQAVLVQESGNELVHNSAGARDLVFAGHTGKVSAVLLAPDRNLLLTGGNSFYKLLQDNAKGAGQGKINVNYPGTDNTVRFWNANTGGQTAIINKGLAGRTTWQIQGLALSPDGTQVAVACCRPGADFCEATVTVWTLDGQKRRHMFSLEGRPGVHAPWFSNDGRTLYALRRDTTVHVFSLSTGNEMSAAKLDAAAAEGGMSSVCMSADRKLVFGGMRDGAIQVWSLRNGKRVQELRGHAAVVRSLALTADDKRLASASNDQTARVWDVETGATIRRFEHQANVSAIGFAGAAGRIATGDDAGLVHLWNVENGEELKRLEGHADAVICLTASPDGRVLATGSADKTARTWILPPAVATAR